MIKSAKFLSSANNINQINLDNNLEIVFLGRSNVGKSSLINTLCKQKNLAKSSSTPGKTRLINFFEICFKIENENKIIHFVDLPGFGYARVSKALQNEWNDNLDFFLKNRANIRLFIHIIDSRHIDLELDKKIQEYLKSIIKDNQNLIIIFTKIDKLNQAQKSKIKKSYPNAILISNTKKDGIKELEDFLYSYIKAN